MRIRIFMLLPLIIGFIACSRYSGESMPNFELLLPDSVTLFHTEKIPAGKPVVIIQFSPDCKECQEETQSILDHIDSLREVRLYFVTFESFDRLQVFQKYYHLEKYTNVTAGKDMKMVLAHHLDDYATPISLVYDKNKLLRAVHKGKADAHVLLNIIRDFEN